MNEEEVNENVLHTSDFFKLMETWAEKEIFMIHMQKLGYWKEEPDKKKRIKLHIMSAKNYDIKEVATTKYRKDLSDNAQKLRCLHWTVGDDRFYTILNEYAGYKVYISPAHQNNIEIYLQYKHKKSYVNIAETYKLSIGTARKRASRACKLYD